MPRDVRRFAAWAVLAAWPATTLADVAVALSITDGGFTPAEVEAPAGQRIALDITNATDAPTEFESAPLNREKAIPAGKSVRLYVNDLAPGRYEFFDETHRERRGVLIVR